jgi:hypothetical protein
MRAEVPLTRTEASKVTIHMATGQFLDLRIFYYVTLPRSRAAVSFSDKPSPVAEKLQRSQRHKLKTVYKNRRRYYGMMEARSPGLGVGPLLPSGISNLIVNINFTAYFYLCQYLISICLIQISILLLSLDVIASCRPT